MIAPKQDAKADQWSGLSLADLPPHQKAALTGLNSVRGHDGDYMNFRHLGQASGLDATQAKRAVRRLASLGLAEYGRGLMTDDGVPYGSGYRITDAGHAVAEGKPFSVGMEAKPECTKPSPKGCDVALTVWYGKMPESNGRENWTATLRRVNPTDKWDMGLCFARSEYPGRVLYEADRMRWIIGERTERPDILAYDADTHSVYVEPPPAGKDMAGEVERLRAALDQSVITLCMLKRNVESEINRHDGLYRWEGVPASIQRQIDNARQALAALGEGEGCKVPPPGWFCTRKPGHEGPCAAWPDHMKPEVIGNG